MKKRLLRFTLLCAFLSGATLAGAQQAETPAARPALADSLTGAAKQAYESAGMLRHNQDWAGALRKFEQAYALSNDPRLLFNMAICARDMRAYARMQQLLKRYEQEAAQQLTSDEKAQVDSALEAIRGLVGTVTLTVNEPDALVDVDGTAAGTTPLTVPLVVDLGKHTLLVRKDGFQPSERVIETVGGTVAAVTVNLVRQQHQARLAIVAEHGATIAIDKTPVGSDRFEGVLPSGTHEIQVTAAGKRNYQSLIDLRDGEARSVMVTLPNEQHGAVLWPWLVGAGVVAAAAAVGGYFLFKPHDERGPGPNSSLPPVDLAARSGGW